MTNNSIQAHFPLSEHYLEAVLERRGVRNNSLYSCIDVLVREELAAVRINTVEQGGLHLEVAYDPTLSNMVEVLRVFAHRGYREFNRTSLKHNRSIIHYHTDVGNTFVDIRPQSIDLSDWLFGEEADVPEHMIVAKDYLNRELVGKGVDGQALFSFVDVLGLYCEEDSLQLTSIGNSRAHPQLRGRIDEMFSAQLLIRKMGKRGYRPLNAVDIHEGQMRVCYELFDGTPTHVELYETS